MKYELQLVLILRQVLKITQNAKGNVSLFSYLQVPSHNAPPLWVGRIKASVVAS